MYTKRWIDYFFDIAERTAGQSKDPSTKVGAVLVKDRRVMATGYNGFAKGINDTYERYHNRDTKLSLVVHAEANCITQCARYGIQSEGLTLFATLVPCTECAKLIISAGINLAIFKKQDLNVKRASSEHEWRDKIKDSVNMLTEAGVELYEYDPEEGILLEMADGLKVTLPTE